MPLSPNTVTLGEVRFSYCTLFQPRAHQGQDPKYSVTVLLPKSNTQAKALLDAAVNYAVEQGIAKCWNGIRPPQPALCVHDGDGPRPSDGQPFGEECRGHWVFTASCLFGTVRSSISSTGAPVPTSNSSSASPTP